MIDIKQKVVNLARRFYTQEPFHVVDDYVQLRGQQANDYIFERLSSMPTEPLMLAKFGTIELGVVCAYETKRHGVLSQYMGDVLHGRIPFYSKSVLSALCQNSGFFPNDRILGGHFMTLSFPT